MRSAWAGGVATVVLASATAFAGEASAREWYQDAANGARTSAVDVEPIRSDPVEAWRNRLDNGAICAPVSWNGTVFVVSKDAQKRQVLTALDARTGSITGRVVRLGHTGDEVELVAWEGSVAVVEPTSVEAFAPQGSSLRSSWRHDGKRFAHPCIHDGRMYIEEWIKTDPSSSDAAPVERVFAMADGRDLGHSKDHFAGVVSVTRSVRPDVDAQIVGLGVGAIPGTEGIWLKVRSRRIQVTDQAGRAGTFLDFVAPDVPYRTPLEFGARVARFRESAELRPWCGVIRIAPEPGERNGAWLFVAGTYLRTTSGELSQIAIRSDGAYEDDGLLPSYIRPAIRAGRAYTFDFHGNVLAIGRDGKYETMLAYGKLPNGAEMGVPSIARNTVCFGNWAMDLDNGRVLWTRTAGEKLRTPSIPVGDRLLLLQTQNGELICLTEPKANLAAPAPGSSTDPAPAPVDPPPPEGPPKAPAELLQYD